MAIVRSILFYPLFYGFSALLVMASVIAVPFGREPLQRVVLIWGRWHRWCLKHIVGIQIVVDGDLPDGGVLIAMKHESFFEAIDLAQLFTFPSVFAKRELFMIPGWGYSAKVYGLIPVAREDGAKALRNMITTSRAFAEEGRPLVIFPEGTRVPHGETRRLQSGFAGIYKLLRLPIVPIAVNSGPYYHGVIKRPGTITYKVGEIIPPGLARGDVEARVLEAINSLNG